MYFSGCLNSSLWSWLFFARYLEELAFVEVIVLWLSILATLIFSGTYEHSLVYC